jgi:hypothetical protein
MEDVLIFKSYIRLNAEMMPTNGIKRQMLLQILSAKSDAKCRPTIFVPIAYLALKVPSNPGRLATFLPGFLALFFLPF